MNVLHITTIGEQALLECRHKEDDFGGGIGKTLINILEFENSRNVNNCLVTACLDGLFSDDARKRNIRVVLVSAKWIKFLGRPLLVWLSVKDLIKIIKDNEVDTVHAHNFAAGFSAGIAARFAGVPMVMSVHQDISEYVTSSPNKIRRMLSILRGQISLSVYKISAFLSKRIVCVSEFVKQSMAKNGFNCKKVEVICNGINIASEKQFSLQGKFRKLLGITSGNILIASVGRLHQVKGYKYLIESAKSILKSHEKVKFVLIGEGDERKTLELQVEEAGIESSFLFAGHRDDVLDILEEIDIFVLSSLSEGFPTVLLEAMAMKKPVIATRVGGVPEIIEHERDGLLVESCSSSQIVEALYRIIDDNALKNMISKNGYDKVKGQFSIDVQVNKFDKIYKKVLET